MSTGIKRRKWLLYAAILLLAGAAIGGGWWWFAQARAGEGKPTDPPKAPAGNGQQGMSQRGPGGVPGAGGMKAGKQAKPLLVEVQSVRRGEVAQFLQVSGEIVATESIVVAATKEGPITFCPWREGDSIRAGEKLVEIDRPIHQAEIEAAEATLSVARAKLADLEAGARPEEIHKAEADVRRWEATCGLCEKALSWPAKRRFAMASPCASPARGSLVAKPVRVSHREDWARAPRWLQPMAMGA